MITIEKEAKERARDYTENKERQIAYECGFLDGVDRMRVEMQKLKEDNKVMSDNYSKMEQKFYDNLTQVKELLKWALHSDPEHDEDFDQKWEEAEQFLKEE